MAASEGEVTQLLRRWSAGDAKALEQLMPIVYEELRRMAQRQMRQERTGHTLQATALVHEAYLKLVVQRRVTWRNRAHFYGVAAQVMRRILVDHARSHAPRRAKPGAARGEQNAEIRIEGAHRGGKKTGQNAREGASAGSLFVA